MNEDPRTSPAALDGGASRPPKARIVVLIEDLMFRSKVRETAAALGMDTAFVGSAGAAAAAFDEPADLVIVDLGAAGLDPIGAVGKAKERGRVVLAFGSHVDAEALAAAARAGADEAVPRSVFSARLADLMTSLIAKARTA